MRFTIPGRLPCLNEIIAAANAGSGKYNPHNTVKRETQERIGWAIISARNKHKIRPITRNERVWIVVEYFEPDRRRDVDNIAAGAKFILDALVETGILPTDGQKCVEQYIPIVGTDKDDPRVVVHIHIIHKGE